MIVVTGATGNVGRPLVSALAEAGAEVTAVSRNATGDVPAGVRQARADLTEPETFQPLLAGAEALFLHNGGAGAGLATARGLLDVAKRAGVRQVVLLSSIGVATRPESESHGVAGRAAEDAVRESGLDWTILRAAAIGAALGEPVRFVALGRDQARAAMLAFMPADVADTTLDALGSPTGHELRISPDVERVTGRAAGTFAGWAARHAAAFR
jgi:uncharacterized protein YbjT (DUF2867 family)